MISTVKESRRERNKRKIEGKTAKNVFQKNQGKGKENERKTKKFIK